MVVELNGMLHPTAGISGCNMPNARIKKPVIQYDLNLNIIKFFDGTGIASRELNICKTAIGRVCKNKAKIAGGFIFKYA